jgi:DNA-binding MarR family transcriptional regulator
MSVNMSEQHLAAWQKMQVVIEILRREVGRDLWADAQLSDSEFTILAHLAAETNGVRPTDCARAIGWDSSRLAHQTRRLEKRGLVARSAAADDGRAVQLSITADGRRAYRASLGPHLQSAKKWFADGLTDEQVDGLEVALDALADHISHLTAVPPHVKPLNS